MGWYKMHILFTILSILLVLFYSTFVDREKCNFAPRLFRWLSVVLSFLPYFGICLFVLWCYICLSKETIFKQNKITNFFIKN